ncbi:hypothetical protein LO772_19330 [Yinghuangia sp. ASG 101]|uniref:alpha/beta hydrolase-fold protein n=1 Tax=Yinghuangia sp. ASG 101 TaxID=2896848 RepID=UPI001E408A65|nr:alpha/beta hydrolase-fold protein [Yinghuangia sp. ASG 101]UGQ09112.1 hypothetical protein LO772_19330 [Yinghuangia sp. ASG 101]
MTRKALRTLLIAVTLGCAVALFVRARRAAPRGEHQPVPVRDFTEGPERPERPADTVGRAAGTGVGTALPAASGRSRAEERASAPPPRPADGPARPTPRADAVSGTSGIVPPADAPPAESAAVAADVVEIAPDRAGAEERPESRRRARVVIGVTALVFVIVAAVVGAMAFDSADSDDGAGGTTPAGAASSAPTQRSATGATDTFGPLPPQNFASEGTRSGGSLNHLLLDGRRSGVSADVWVWLPPQYQRDDMRAKRFPVLVVHSAYPGIGENSLLGSDFGLLDKITSGIASGSLPPFVVVAPELTSYQQSELDAASTPKALDTECSDIPGHPRMATFHNEDVREAVAATFRVATDRSSWALLGEESGGLCATKYALQYPQYYATAASLSGGTTLRSPLWPTDAGVREPEEPAALLAAHPDVNLLLVDPTSDTAGRQASTAFKNAAQPPTIVETTTNSSSDTSRQLPAALAFFERNVTDSTLASGDGSGSSGSTQGRSTPTGTAPGATATATKRTSTS